MLKILTSPAKLMKIDTQNDFLKPTTPKFIKESAKIQEHLKKKNPKILKDLMNISEDLAQENWERNQKWSAKPTSKNSAPALYAFNGQVYKGLDAKTLKKSDVEYLQEHYLMISGLYGLLRPSDKIMLYRLEMGCGFSFENHKNLYDFWQNKLTNELNKSLKKSDFVLNLASNEYSKAINFKELKAPVIDFKFYEMKNGKPKTIVVYTKNARGLVVRYCAQNKVEKLEEVKSFNLENYLFNDELSTEKTFVFTR